MKILFASDIHGSLVHAQRLIHLFEKEQADVMVLLGDFLYHGPRNALPSEYDPQAVADLLNRYQDKIIGIRGNCESEVDELLLDFPLVQHSILWLDQRRVFLTHGHVYHRDNLGKLQAGDILIHGHFHVPVYVEVSGVLVLSPGSISIPKQASTFSYMVYEKGNFIIKNNQQEDITQQVKQWSINR